jgi:hypothetical protein
MFFPPEALAIDLALSAWVKYHHFALENYEELVAWITNLY